MDKLYNLSFERSVLSSIIFDPASFEYISSLLNKDMFYLQAHKDIFEAMLDLTQQEKPIDEEFIKEWLLQKKRFNEVALLDVISANPIANTKAYILELVEKAKLRALIRLSADIKKQVLEENASSGLVISSVDNTTNSIVDMQSSMELQTISIEDIEDGQTQYILKDFIPIPKGTVCFVSAPGGTGKSWTALQMAIRFAHDSGKKAAVWLSEDPLFESKKRALAIKKDILKTTQSLKDVHLVPHTPLPLIENEKFNQTNFYKIKKQLQDFEFIVFDPLLAFYGADENSNTIARRFMQPFINWAQESGKTIVFLHHSRKTKDTSESSSTRGAGAFIDAVRTAYEIRSPKEQTNMREFYLTKDNLGVIKFLKSFNITREITPKPSNVVEIVYEEKKYTQDMPFLGNKVADNQEKIEIEGGMFL